MDKTKISLLSYHSIVVVGLLYLQLRLIGHFTNGDWIYIVYFPFMFISSYLIMSFILAFIYNNICYSDIGFHDFDIICFRNWWSYCYYRIRTTKNFSPTNYKEQQKNKKIYDKEINIFSQGLNFIQDEFYLDAVTEFQKLIDEIPDSELADTLNII